MRWNLDSVHIERRRKTFWELNASDKWKSLGTGRPALFASHVIDCEFPTDMYKITDADGEVYEGSQLFFPQVTANDGIAYAIHQLEIGNIVLLETYYPNSQIRFVQHGPSNIPKFWNLTG